MSQQWELPLEPRGEALHAQRSGAARPARAGAERSGTDHRLMERVIGRANAVAAFQRVRRNKGRPGIDGMTVEELLPYLRVHWRAIREALLAGTYRPSAVQRQRIPKPGGGVRELGIPTVLDRFIQQLLLQVLQPIFDPTFSEHSHGFRPGRRAHDAVREAQHYVQAGRRWVVDVDLAQFFDRVHHDVLMGKLYQRIADQRVLRIIRRFLEAGIMADGVVVARHEGTPQGGPLSPLLANVLLDDVDQELERRGHCFVRYADDCNVYVRSRRAGERVLAALRQQYAKLRLRINEEKSAVARVWDRKFLGYGFWVAPGRTVKRRVAANALEELKQRVRQITRRSGGRSLVRVTSELGAYLRGWREYFKLADTPGCFAALDSWIHHRLRAIRMKQQRTGHGRRWWWASALGALHTALPGDHFERLGVPRLAAPTSTF
jgi:RNA-directed DNA polymerase